MARLRAIVGSLDCSLLRTLRRYGKRLLCRDGTMSKDDSYVAKTQAIRVCVVEHPGAAPQQIVELLAADGMRVSPAQVIVVQAVQRSERSDRIAAAS